GTDWPIRFRKQTFRKILVTIRFWSPCRNQIRSEAEPGHNRDQPSLCSMLIKVRYENCNQNKVKTQLSQNLTTQQVPHRGVLQTGKNTPEFTSSNNRKPDHVSLTCRHMLVQTEDSRTSGLLWRPQAHVTSGFNQNLQDNFLSKQLVLTSGSTKSIFKFCVRPAGSAGIPFFAF
ncbi:hypothetical protein GOODEAATRI_030502, partial [Goodea atripinnis]